MSINHISASLLQTTLQRIIGLDCEAVSKLKQFDEKVVHIHVTNLKLNYYISFINAELFVSSTCNKNITATISGDTNAFITSILSEHVSDSIFKGELLFSGEIGTAKQLQAFAQSLNVDWQEPLAQLLGDPVAYTIALGFNNLSKWATNAFDSLTMDVSEYIQEEARVSPSEIEQQYFFQQVDALRSGADRLTARLSRLQVSQSSVN